MECITPPNQKISYPEYLDKVYGCWMGKSLGGTLGGPYEGRKELFSYTFDRSAIDVVLPNDDLDLQVLWLHVLEQKGLHLTSRDLADAFANLVPYAPGEYAIFKKNFARGLYPPLTGAFNNPYYFNGMGCPIRSEIWACVCPGNPEKAAAFAVLDGVLDHVGDSIRAEQYLSAIEAAAFLDPELDRLLIDMLPWLGEDTRIRRLVEDTMLWCKQVDDWREVWRRIVRDYGHPDCTNLYQNIGFTILALKHGGGDFIRTLMIAVNCGFDADCSCATAGAILGLIDGASGLAKKYGFTDPSFKLSIPLERRSYRLDDLAEDTCRIGLACTAAFNPRLCITSAPTVQPLRDPEKPALQVDIEYGKDPVIGWGETKNLCIKITGNINFRGNVTLALPEGWQSDWAGKEIQVTQAESLSLPLAITVPKSVDFLSEKNILQLHFDGGGSKLSHRFGLVGAQVWKVYGPYWKNWTDLPHEALGKGYYDMFPKEYPGEKTTLVRNYHLNVLPDLSPAGFTEPDGSVTSPEKLRFAGMDYVIAQTREDKFELSSLIGFQGPCTVYAERLLHSPGDRTVHLQIGHTDPFSLWLNGELLGSSDSMDWWTGENIHRKNVHLLAGENHLLLKLVRRSAEAWFSPVFTTKGTCSDHVDDLGSLIRLK